MKRISISIFFVFICVLSKAQFANLVMEGSGVRGIAYTGALKVLDSLHYLQNIQRVAGTSGGAIQAAMLSVGYSPTEVENILLSIPIQSLNDGKFGVFGGLHRLHKYYGWYQGIEFRKQLEKYLFLKTNIHNITFTQIDSLARINKQYKQLFIVVSNITMQKSEVLSATNYPNMQVADAVRLSMSIPFYFKALWVSKDGSVHSKQTISTDQIIIDGGLLNNFPIEIFDSTKYINVSKPNEYIRNKQTLGLMIERDKQMKNDSTDILNLVDYKIENMKDYASSIYTSVMEYHNRVKLVSADKDRIIFISDKMIGPKIKKISDATKNTLIQSGQEAALFFFRYN